MAAEKTGNGSNIRENLKVYLRERGLTPESNIPELCEGVGASVWVARRIVRGEAADPRTLSIVRLIKATNGGAEDFQTAVSGEPVVLPVVTTSAEDSPATQQLGFFINDLTRYQDKRLAIAVMRAFVNVRRGRGRFFKPTTPTL